MEVKEQEGLTLTCKLPFLKMITMNQAKCTFFDTYTVYFKNLHNTGNNTGTTVHNTKVTEIERCAAQSMLDYNLKRTFLK